MRDRQFKPSGRLIHDLGPRVVIRVVCGEEWSPLTLIIKLDLKPWNFLVSMVLL